MPDIVSGHTDAMGPITRSSPESNHVIVHTWPMHIRKPLGTLLPQRSVVLYREIALG